MLLDKSESDHFFFVYNTLLYFAYSHFGDLEFEDFYFSDAELHIMARDLLMKDRSLFDSYLDNLREDSGTVPDPAHMALLRAIQNARFDEFIAVEKDRQLYCIDYRKGNMIYEVTGLTDEAINLVPRTPVSVKTALIQFDEDRIITDGLFRSSGKKHKKNAARLIMRDFEDEFDEKLSPRLRN